jgi:hypothetical protein
MSVFEQNNDSNDSYFLMDNTNTSSINNTINEVFIANRKFALQYYIGNINLRLSIIELI